MGFIAAMFLSYMPEEDAFFLLLSLLQFEPHKLAGLYAPGMPMVGLLHFQFHELVKKKLPKLSKHLEKHGLHPTIFASQVRKDMTFTVLVSRAVVACLTMWCGAVVYHSVHVQLSL